MPKREKRNGNAPDESIRQFLNREECKRADAYEELINADESLKDIKATPEMYEDMMRRIAAVDAEKEREAARKTEDGEYAYVSEADRKAMELGKKVLARRKYRKVWQGCGVAAALLAVVIGYGASSEAGKFRIANFWNFLVGQETVIRTENDVPEDAVASTHEEEMAWSEIEEKTGIVPVKFMYFPEGVEFDGYEVEEKHRTAKLFYKYENTIIKVLMTAGEDSTNSLKSEMHYDGVKVDEIPVTTRYGEYSIVETKADQGNNYIFSIEKDNCSYAIYGIINRDEFVKMIEKIFF